MRPMERIPDWALPPQKVNEEALPGVNVSLFESSAREVQTGNKWSGRDEVLITPRDKQPELITPAHQEDDQFLLTLDKLYQKISGDQKPSFNKILEIGASWCLTLSRALEKFDVGLISVTNLLSSEENLLKTSAPNLHERISKFYSGTLNTIAKLATENKEFDLIQGLRCFNNSDTKHNRNIVDQWVFWLGQLQQPGGLLIFSPFSKDFLPICRQAWDVKTGIPVYRKGFKSIETDLGELLRSSGYKIIASEPYNHTSVMKRFFPDKITLLDPGTTHFLIAAEKVDPIVKMDQPTITRLSNWIRSYEDKQPHIEASE